jgi:phosphinothricin acetyltransferase
MAKEIASTERRGQPIVVRDAQDADMPAVRDLYNALIETTTVAWTEARQTLRERRAWFRRQQRIGYPVLVAEADGVVVGFAAYGSFRGSGKWPGYRHTVEHTIHVREDSWGRGIGRGLIDGLVDQARADGVHVMVAAIDGANTESISFHERLGFTVVARMPEVGRKFDRWLDQPFIGRPPSGSVSCRDGTIGRLLARRCECPVASRRVARTAGVDRRHGRVDEPHLRHDGAPPRFGFPRDTGRPREARGGVLRVLPLHAGDRRARLATRGGGAG